VKYELWQYDEAKVIVYDFFPVDEIYERRLQLLEPGSKLAWTVEADTYNEAMKLYQEHMDWEPYKPWEDD
jgi:hypothetical protein